MIFYLYTENVIYSDTLQQTVSELRFLSDKLKNIDRLFITFQQAKKTFDSLMMSLDDLCIEYKLNEYGHNLNKLKSFIDIFSKEIKIALTKVYAAIQYNRSEIDHIKTSIVNMEKQLDEILNLLKNKS